MKKKIILDCDPGHDDAFAIMLAAQHLDLRGISTIGGNCSLEHVTTNALKILELIGRPDIPVCKGHSCPMVAPLVTAPQFHGETGLDGPVLPEPKIQARPQHGVDFIIDTVRAEDDITLVATGPLTNVAAAINRAPDIVKRLREISLMGGSVTFGNWTPSAEFNIFVDPEAAYRVFNSGVHIKMSGLNMTRQCAITATELEDIKKIPTNTAKVAVELLRFFMNATDKSVNLPEADLHDACAVAWLIDPSLIKAAPMFITVELKGEFTRGMTVCDYRHLRSRIPAVDLLREPSTPFRGEKPNAEAGLELNMSGFMKLLCDTLRNYP
jgi:pyrimidine-specific ribonucleoside hydrolase